MYSAFREADAIRRIERCIDDKARAAIEEALPFRVHFAELSSHVLHVAFRGKKPIGLLYVRSEETEAGLSDIAWAVTLDGRITGFQFVHARTARANELPSTPFGKSMVGKTLADLRAELAAPAGETRGDDLERIAARSAMKATAVIEVVWADEVRKLADLAMLYDEFPGAERYRRQVLPAAAGETAVTRGSLYVMEAEAQGNFRLGSAIATTCRIGGADVGVRFVLGNDGRIVRAMPTVSWATGELRAMCSALPGRRLDDAALADNPLTSAANEIATALAARQRARAR